MRLCISLVLMLPVAAWAGTMRLPNPPEVPAGAMDKADANSLAGQRTKLLKRKREILMDLKKYNAEVPTPVPKDKEAFYKDWVSRLATAGASYRDDEAEFRDDVKRACLRMSVAGLQEALRRLNRSIQSDSAQLAEWEKTTEATVEHAKGMLVDMVLDAMLAVPQDRMGKLYEEVGKQANEELQRVATLIAGETNAARREQLHAAYKLLAGQRDGIRNVQTLQGNLRQAQAVKDLGDLADMPENQKLAEGVKQLLAVMDDPALDEAMAKQIGLKLPAATLLGKAAVHYRYGEKLVDVTYDVTAVSVAWARIRQLNRNTDEYLQAVGKLKDRMETTVKLMKKTGKETNP